jgi:hypothetical protein
LNSQLEALDPDDLLTFSFKPPSLVASPGTATFAKVRARPRKRFFRGQPKTIPFQVRVKSERGEARVVDGAVVQEPLIPKWALAAVLALAALAALWALVLRPEIQSTAKDAVKEPLAAQQKQVDEAASAATQAAQDANAATKSANAAAESAQHAQDAVTGKNVKVDVTAPNTVRVVTGLSGRPTSFRLQTECPPTCTAAHAVPKPERFALTDIVLNNPNADTGTLTLSRGETVLFDEGLANFRGIDFHFVAPIVVPGGTKLVLEVKCDNRTAQATGATEAATTGPCTASAFLAGFIQQEKKSAQKPKP